MRIRECKHCCRIVNLLPGLERVDPKRENVDSFVEQQRDQGRYDSSGQFRLDRSRAKVKLQRHQMEQPAGYLLKLVQAAVLLRPRKIRVRLNSDAVEMILEEPEPLLNCSTVVEVLGQPLSRNKQDLLGCLSLGLNVAPATAIEFRDRPGGQAIRIAEDGISEWTVGTNNNYGLRLEREGLYTLANEHQALCQRACFSPVPIWLDGRLISRATWDRALWSSRVRRAPRVRGWCCR